MLRCRDKAKESVLRAQNMLERADGLTNLWDQVGRSYYACFHAMRAAIWLRGVDAEISMDDEAHDHVITLYVENYSKTVVRKRNEQMIFPMRDVDAELKNWKWLGTIADYEVFHDAFIGADERKTEKAVERMQEFARAHIDYVKAKLGEDDKTRPTIPTMNMDF